MQLQVRFAARFKCRDLRVSTGETIEGRPIDVVPASNHKTFVQPYQFTTKIRIFSVVARLPSYLVAVQFSVM